MSEIINEVKKILEKPSGKLVNTGDGFRYIDKQISTITAQRYKLNWKPKVMFEYICNTFKEEAFEKRLNKKNLSLLYRLLDTEQKRKIIQRLDKIILKNKQKGSKTNGN